MSEISIILKNFLVAISIIPVAVSVINIVRRKGKAKELTEMLAFLESVDEDEFTIAQIQDDCAKMYFRNTFGLHVKTSERVKLFQLLKKYNKACDLEKFLRVSKYVDYSEEEAFVSIKKKDQLMQIVWWAASAIMLILALFMLLFSEVFWRESLENFAYLKSLGFFPLLTIFMIYAWKIEPFDFAIRVKKRVEKQVINDN